MRWPELATGTVPRTWGLTAGVSSHMFTLAVSRPSQAVQRWRRNATCTGARLCVREAVHARHPSNCPAHQAHVSGTCPSTTPRHATTRSPQLSPSTTITNPRWMPSGGTAAPASIPHESPHLRTDLTCSDCEWGHVLDAVQGRNPSGASRASRYICARARPMPGPASR